MDTIQANDEGERDESSAGRLHFWKVAIDMANANAATGVGLGAFSLAYESYNYSGDFGGERSAHSVWFGVLGDLGYVGLVLLVANLTFSFWSCWRVHRIARSRPPLRDLRIYANAIISALVVFCAAGTFLSAQYNEMAWHLVGLSTALRLIAHSEAEAFDSAKALTTQAA
jgi:O-antigen ligase